MVDQVTKETWQEDGTSVCQNLLPALNKSHSTPPYIFQLRRRETMSLLKQQMPNTWVFFATHWDEVVIAQGAQELRARNVGFLSNVQ